MDDMAQAPAPYLDALLQLTVRQSGVDVGTSPIINLDSTITATYNETTGAIDLTANGGGGGTSRMYVSCRFDSTSTGRVYPMWFNDSHVGAVTVTSNVFVPVDAVSQSDTDYWSLQLVLASDTSTPLRQITTQLTGGTALMAGVAVSFPGDVSVPIQDTLCLKTVATGSPSSLGGMAQGYHTT